MKGLLLYIAPAPRSSRNGLMFNAASFYYGLLMLSGASTPHITPISLIQTRGVCCRQRGVCLQEAGSVC